MNFFLMMSGLDGDDQAKFKQWLDQYETVAAVEDFFENNPGLPGPESFTENIGALKALAKKRDDVPVEPGQIRLLNQDMTNNPDEFTCVLVLSSRYNNRWLVAPFSPYTQPATQWELDTGIEFHAYRVIESWNAVVVPDYFLQVQSSFLRNADEAVRRDALALYYREQDGKENPGEFRDRTGAPVRFELDPRNQYLANEAFQLEPMRNKIEKAEEFLREMEPWGRPAAESEPGMGIAAAFCDLPKMATSLFSKKALHGFAYSLEMQSSREARNKRPGVFLAVSGRPEQIRITLEEDGISLEVYSGNRVDRSGTLDSWFAVSKDGRILARIRGSRCVLAGTEKNGFFCLADPEGNLFALRPEME